MCRLSPKNVNNCSVPYEWQLSCTIISTYRNYTPQFSLNSRSVLYLFLNVSARMCLAQLCSPLTLGISQLTNTLAKTRDLSRTFRAFFIQKDGSNGRGMANRVACLKWKGRWCSKWGFLPYVPSKYMKVFFIRVFKPFIEIARVRRPFFTFLKSLSWYTYVYVYFFLVFNL
jgi:hypothetical protein